MFLYNRAIWEEENIQYKKVSRLSKAGDTFGKVQLCNSSFGKSSGA